MLDLNELTGEVDQFMPIDRRHVRKHVQPGGGRHRETAHAAGSDVFDRRRGGGKIELNLTREQIGESGCSAAIRNVLDCNASLVGKIFCDQVAAGSSPCRIQCAGRSPTTRAGAA